MKKIALLALLLLTPLVVFADPPAGGIGVGGGVGNTGTAQTGTYTPPPSVFDGGTSAPDLSAPPPVDGTAITSVQENAQQQQEGTASTAADIASNINQCGQPSTGSAFQQALSGIGSRLGRAALQGVANGLSGYGPLGRAAGSILTGAGVGDVARGLVGSVGNYAGNAVGQEISGACGDSSLGRQICGTVGSAVGNYVNGAINQYGGQILNNVGLGSIGGLFGGSTGGSGISGIFGGSGGGIVSSVLGGGGSVPVSDQGTQQRIQQASQSADQIANQTQQIVNHTDQQTGLLVFNTCEAGPTVAALNARAIAAAQGRVLQAAAQQQRSNPGGDQLDIHLAAVSQLANDPTLTSDQRAVVSQWANQETQGQAIDCNAQSNSSGSYGTQIMQSINFGVGCSNTALLNRYLSLERAADQNIQTMTSTNNGPYPQGVCVSGPNAGQTNDPRLCPLPGQYRITLTSSDIAALQQRAEGHQFDLSTAAIGAAADRLGAQLIDEIFTTVGNELESGLQRLVSNRTNGSSGRGSFVNQLSGNVGPSQQQAGNYLTQNITDALSIEAQYQESTQSILDSLTATQTVFTNIQSCYATLAAHPAGSITAAAAQTATDNASTTVNIVLGRQITARQQNIDSSQSAVNDLGVLLDQVQSATRAEQINNVADTYNAMIAGGRIHTTEELQLLADDVNQLLPALSLAKDDAATQLTQCQAYGTATSSTGG